LKKNQPVVVPSPSVGSEVQELRHQKEVVKLRKEIAELEATQEKIPERLEKLENEIRQLHQQEIDLVGNCYEGRVEIMAAVLILVGSAAGVQIGATATRYVHGANIRQYFAITILLAGVAVVLKQVAYLFDLNWLGTIAIYLLIGVASGISLLITVIFIRARNATKKGLDIR